MPKRLPEGRNDEEPSYRPKRTTRQTVPTASSLEATKPVPTAGPSRATSIHSGNVHDKSSSEKILPVEALVQEVLKMAENESKAELMILELMGKYSFSITHLNELLKGKLNTLESL